MVDFKLDTSRVEMPYKVRIVGGPTGTPTRYRDGRVTRVANRYFATKAEAVAFCGDPRRVIYAPGEAWRPIPSHEHGAAK